MIFKDQAYPTRTRGSKNFKWAELIISASAPSIALKYAKTFPNGKWPKLTDPALWDNPNDYRLVRLRKLATPELLEQPVSRTMSDHLRRLVEPLRAALGGHPMKIISGWRPPELNSAVGGAELSGHLIGVATDVEADPRTKKAAKEWAIERQTAVGDVGFFKTYAWGFHIASTRGFSDGIIDSVKYTKVA